MKIQVKNGNYSYPREKRTVLRDISFGLEAGEVLAILGPNGAGKTTLLRCMMGLLPWQSGMTYIDDRPISEISRKNLWQWVSYVPQAKPPQVAYTVEEMILLGRTSVMGAFELPKQEDMSAVDRCIKKTHLESIRHRSCGEISGGELQMVLMARALVSAPKILLLDEPESNLDFKNQLLILNMISELSREGITCIFNTHYPAHGLRWGTKAMMLGKDGSYVFGKVSDIVTEENILRYFGVRSLIDTFEQGQTSYLDVIPISIEKEF